MLLQDNHYKFLWLLDQYGRSFPPTNVLHAYPGRLWQFVNKNGKSTNKDNIKIDLLEAY